MKYIFLNGVPRSGTTWLMSLFQSHPNIKSIFQPLFSYEFKNYLTEESTKQDFQKFLSLIYKTTNKFCLLESDLHQFEKPVFNKNDINMLFIKHVRYHNLLHTFIDFDPTIKIILLIRNPYAVIHSQLSCNREKDEDWLNARYKNDGKNYNYFGYNRWKDFVDLSVELQKKHPKNVIIIKYSELLENTFEVLQNLCMFLDIDFHQNMKLAISKFSSENGDGDYTVYNQKIDDNDWKDKLDSNIIDFITKDLDVSNDIYKSFL